VVFSVREMSPAGVALLSAAQMEYAKLECVM
jgi:hypothetical protein